jgi:hypothetical protein
MKKLFKKGEIERPEDLSPRGVKSTIKGTYGFNEVFDHIFNEARKPDLSWKNN